MKPVYKHLSGSGTQHNSNGPIRAKMKHVFISQVMVRCRCAYHKPSRKAKQLNFTQICLHFLKSFDHQSKLIWDNI